MADRIDHHWVRRRLVSWRTGLLSDDDAARVVAHLEVCLECRAYDDAFQIAPDPDAGVHVPPGLLADWPRASRTLQGLERGMVRHHLERCAECRQDLEMLGHVPALDVVPGLEPHSQVMELTLPASKPRAPGSTTTTTSSGIIIRLERPRSRFGEWWSRALVGWATVATAAAIIAVVINVRRPIVEGAPPWAMVAAPRTAQVASAAGLSLRITPPTRKLSGPTSGEAGGKVNVIPVAGPVSSLALAVRPLNVPDTSLVTVALLNARGDTLFSVAHRQWEFFPQRVLVIDSGDDRLPPGRYALEMVSMIAGDASPVTRMSRYQIELRPR